jgi:hypothetical protein
MPRVYALEVAFKNRPKTFQRFVACLFSVALSVIAFSSLSWFESNSKRPVQSRIQKSSVAESKVGRLR